MWKGHPKSQQSPQLPQQLGHSVSMVARLGTGTPLTAGSTPGWSLQPPANWTPRGHPIRPCFRCAGWGHLQNSCPKTYSFNSECCDGACICDLNSMHRVGPMVNAQSSQTNYMGPQLGTTFDLSGMPVELEVEPRDDICPRNLCRSWEMEQNTTPVLWSQVMDVRGRFKECSSFWLDTLEAPPTVLDWVQIATDVFCLHSAQSRVS